MKLSKKVKKQLRSFVYILIILAIITILSYFGIDVNEILKKYNSVNASSQVIELSFDLDSIPEFDGSTPYVIINNNEPNFEEKYFTSKSFEQYSDLDKLGRCSVAFANVGKDTMPTSERESISSVKPTGWNTAKYDFVDGKYLYNRCHLIGYQLTAENANERNLITGTRYMNVEGMLPFENQIAEYIKQTKKHVLYRVTPIFKDDNLVASGVQMEAESVEDRGEKVKFNVYVYNNQPGVEIDYKTGKNKLSK